MTADDLWRSILAGTEILKNRPNFRYDPVFCARYYPDFVANRAWLVQVLEKTVMLGKRGGNAYQMLQTRIPNINRSVAELVRDPRLRKALDQGLTDSHELAFELMALGGPIDQQIGDFSQDHYFGAYPDIAQTGVSGLRHFIQAGMAEGRHSLRDVRANQHKGALALDPDVVFLDEPTSGLDPLGAAAFDELIADLRDALGLTVFMVTHDLDSLFSVCDRVAVLGNQKVLTVGTVDEVRRFDHPWVQNYFNTGRAVGRDVANAGVL